MISNLLPRKLSKNGNIQNSLCVCVMSLLYIVWLYCDIDNKDFLQKDKRMEVLESS